MRKITYIICSLFMLCGSCSGDMAYVVDNDHNVELKIFQPRYAATKIVDEDNLAVEQTITNISVFFTEPSSEVITYKLINSGFSSVDDYKLVTLPMQASELLTKDIYVVTNYSDAATLNSLNTLTELRALYTPEVNKNNNLDPAKGFCMYGKTLGVDFTDDANLPATVEVIRSCAKYRVSLRFPDSQSLSIDNSFVIADAANYTYVTNDVAGSFIPSDAYFNFASPIELAFDGTNYVNLAYVYEASVAPSIYLYTHIENAVTPEEFSAQLPIPVRNYLYDVEVFVYEDQATPPATASGSRKHYAHQMKVTVYDAAGRMVPQH